MTVSRHCGGLAGVPDEHEVPYTNEIETGPVLALGLDKIGSSSSSSCAFSLYASLPGVSRNTPEKTICIIRC